MTTGAAPPARRGALVVALWVAVVAFVVMALWRLVEAGLGRSTDPKSQGAPAEVLDRVKAFALAVVYFALAYSTSGFARGAGKSTGDQNSGISARLMQTGPGTIGLIAGGVIIVAVGGYHIYKGATPPPGLRPAAVALRATQNSGLAFSSDRRAPDPSRQSADGCALWSRLETRYLRLPSPLRHNIFRQTRAPFGPHSDEDLRWRPGAPQACHFASVIANNLSIGNPQAAS